MQRKQLNPTHLMFTGMSQGVRVGPWTTTSGQVALGHDGVIVGDDGETQAQQCFRNIAAVLAEGGVSLADIVKLTCFIVDVNHFPGYAKVKAALFPEAPPASTTVVVAGLLDARMLMEVEAIAYKTSS